MVVWSRLDLGVGLIAAGGVDLLWRDIDDLVDVVEVEPQTLWDHTVGDGRQFVRDSYFPYVFRRIVGEPIKRRR